MDSGRRSCMRRGRDRSTPRECWWRPVPTRTRAIPTCRHPRSSRRSTAITTSLMRAAKTGDVGAMRILLAHGADPTLTQNNHTTALMFAAGNGRGTGVFQKDIGTERDLIDAVHVLVERGVDVNLANDNGQT